jgi:deazaflavin-dependent oxidoreductase (nitroreductase family)
MDQTLLVDRQAPYLPVPAFVRRVIGPLIMRFGVAPTLVVTGRSSGRQRSVPVEPIEVSGARYIVSTQGLSHWARNLSAAGRGELRRRGAVETFLATAVTGQERDVVVTAYRERASARVKKLFAQLPEAGDHPTFRVESVG